MPFLFSGILRTVKNVAIPYSKLFSLGANFPRFHEWSLLGKVYSGLLCKVSLWVVIAKIDKDTIIISRWPINIFILSLRPWVAKHFNLQLQSK